jgi:hypothetical protein
VTLAKLCRLRVSRRAARRGCRRRRRGQPTYEPVCRGAEPGGNLQSVFPARSLTREGRQRYVTVSARPGTSSMRDGAGRGMRTLQNVRIFATVGDTCILGARIPWHEVEG